ncbi:MAG: hypothetical protein JWN40_3952 [Phycisphaerales bacterium]|nr:hypothetical protein [Phycisphaerales bacterium]
MLSENLIDRARRALPKAALLLALTGAGCQSSVRVAPVAMKAGPTTVAASNTPAAQIEFWHTLNDQPLASYDDAFHGLLLYFDGKDESADYAARVQTLKARGWLARDFAEGGDRAVHRGTVAQALVTALKFKGGLTMRLLGSSPRYALRELQFRGLLPDSSPNQVFTGGEFVGVIGKVEDLRTGNPADIPAPFLPEEARLARGGAPSPDAPAIYVMRPENDRPDAVDPALRAAGDPRQFTLSEPIFAMILAPDDAATQPLTGPLVATVDKFQGMPQFRLKDGAPWEAITAGLKLPEDATVRTGPKDAIVLSVPPDVNVGVSRLTTATILKAYGDRGKVKVDIGMKVGNTRLDIAGAGVEHEATIRSPNSNLAIRGTSVSLFDQRPYTPEAVSLTGRAVFSPLRRQAIAFGGKGAGKTVIRSDSSSPAQFAVGQAYVDPGIGGARTPSEEALLTTLISRGGIVSFDPDAGIRVVRGGGRPSDSQIPAILPGLLSFVVRWDGPANLDLALSTPNFPDGHSEFIYPIGGLDRSRSGGKTPFDHRGGAGGGIEVVYWPTNTFIGGTYALSVQRVSGPPVTATIQAFLRGQPLNLDPDSFDPVIRVDKQVSADTGAVQFVTVPTEAPQRSRKNRTSVAATPAVRQQPKAR